MDAMLLKTHSGRSYQGNFLRMPVSKTVNHFVLAVAAGKDEGVAAAATGKPRHHLCRRSMTLPAVPWAVRSSLWFEPMIFSILVQHISSCVAVRHCRSLIIIWVERLCATS